MTPIEKYENPALKCSDRGKIWGMIAVFVAGIALTSAMMYQGGKKLSGVSKNISQVQREVKEMRSVLKEYSDTTASNWNKSSAKLNKVESRLTDVERRLVQLEDLKNKISN